MSTFGTFFRVTTYGESHCRSVGCIVDGCPPGLALTEADIQPQMSRRRPGQSAITTPRDEKDRVEIQSGTEFGITLGTPIGLRVMNEDQRPRDYAGSTMEVFPRPSHADWTYLEKYGVKASSGGGRSSARETIGRVAAGAVAETYLQKAFGTEIIAFVSSIGNHTLFPTSPPPSTQSGFQKIMSTITRADVDTFCPVRCPDQEVSSRMESLVLDLRNRGDSVGGTVTCVIRNCPPGLGEPCFDKLEAQLAHAMLSIPATKSFEVGSGLAGCSMLGSEHNDPFVLSDEVGEADAVDAKSANAPATSLPATVIVPPNSQSPSSQPLLQPLRARLKTKTNMSGGIQGGISNGAPIYFTVGFKPPATIGVAQQTASFTGDEGVLEAKGRHDPCVVPRAVPIVEAMAALVVADASLAQLARRAAADLILR